MIPTSHDEARTPLASAKTLSDIVQAAAEITHVQTELLRSDLARWRSQLMVPVLLLIGSMAVIVSCCPLLLLSIALLAAELAAVSFYVSLFLVTSFAIGFGLFVAVISWRWIRRLPSPFRHLRNQLTVDLQWLVSRMVR